MTETATQSPPHPEESLKETFESVVMAFILAFVFRAYVVEAFVIPTGSMAPTLMGQHIQVNCAECGYDFRFDVQPQDRRLSSRYRSGRREAGYLTKEDGLDAICPMCHFPNPVKPGTRISAGDRILVHKYIYSISEPKRWDVVVFKNPSDPKTNFIKRLVGLPEEMLWIIDGNIYVKPADDPDARWCIARKTEREEVQRTVWQPVYDSAYIPRDGGAPNARRGDAEWRSPWLLQSRQWEQPVPGRFRHDGPQRAELRFDFGVAMNGGMGLYAYNQFRASNTEPVEDVRVAMVVTPDEPGLAVELATTTRAPMVKVDAKQIKVIARIDERGDASIEMIDPNTGYRETRPAPPGVKVDLPAGRASLVEFWLVDQESSLWVNGKRIMAWGYEVDIDKLVKRPPPMRAPEIHIAIQGGGATIQRAMVDRDIFYSSSLGGDSSTRAWGALVKNIQHDNTIEHEGSPFAIEHDQFFCLGDNSPCSSDSRYWTEVNSWIRQRMFSEHRQQLGVVPRKLMMGRAFFVYFPAMHSMSPSAAGFIPNFGEMRFIH